MSILCNDCGYYATTECNHPIIEKTFKDNHDAERYSMGMGCKANYYKSKNEMLTIKSAKDKLKQIAEKRGSQGYSVRESYSTFTNDLGNCDYEVELFIYGFEQISAKNWESAFVQLDKILMVEYGSKFADSLVEHLLEE